MQAGSQKMDLQTLVTELAKGLGIPPPAPHFGNPSPASYLICQPGAQCRSLLVVVAATRLLAPVQARAAPAQAPQVAGSAAGSVHIGHTHGSTRASATFPSDSGVPPSSTATSQYCS